MLGDLRITHGVQRGESFTIVVDGVPVQAFPGETVAGALLAAGRYWLRHASKTQARRGLFCGIGYCHDCRMTIDGRPNTRACLTRASPNLRVATQGTDSP